MVAYRYTRSYDIGMFRELLADYTEQPAAALDQQLRELELAARELDARRLAVRAAAEARQVPALDGHTSTQAYLRATCNQRSGIALAEVRRARVCRDYPQVGDALAEGRIGLAQIDELVRIHTNDRARPQLDDAQVDLLVGHAQQFRIRDFAVLVDRWLAWADADGAAHDERGNVEARTATVIADTDGLLVHMAGGSKLAAEEFKQIHAHFTKREFQRDVDDRRNEHGYRADQFPLARTPAQRKHDALLAMARAGYAATTTSNGNGNGKNRLPEPVVNILCDQRTVDQFLTRAGIVLANGQRLDVDTLTKQQIAAVLAEFANDPEAILTRRCETASGQQINPHELLQLLLTAHVRRVVLDSKSTVIDLGRRQRLFTGSSRIALGLTQRTCTHPGCDLPADQCQGDHNNPHSQGGPTDQANGALTCGTHNRFKHRNGWRTRRADNGRLYNIRADGTLVLFIGETPPTFEHADADEQRQRGLTHLNQLRATWQAA
jgi:hypothetical protein